MRAVRIHGLGRRGQYQNPRSIECQPSKPNPKPNRNRNTGVPPNVAAAQALAQISAAAAKGQPPAAVDGTTSGSGSGGSNGGSDASGSSSSAPTAAASSVNSGGSEGGEGTAAEPPAVDAKVAAGAAVASSAAAPMEGGGREEEEEEDEEEEMEVDADPLTLGDLRLRVAAAEDSGAVGVWRWCCRVHVRVMHGLVADPSTKTNQTDHKTPRHDISTGDYTPLAEYLREGFSSFPTLDRSFLLPPDQEDGTRMDEGGGQGGAKDGLGLDLAASEAFYAAVAEAEAGRRKAQAAARMEEEGGGGGEGDDEDEEESLLAAVRQGQALLVEHLHAENQGLLGAWCF